MCNNNFKTKEMYFGQYIGLDVFCDKSVGLDKESYQEVYHSVGDMAESSFIKLKSVENLSNEDAIEFFDIVWSKVGSHKDKPKDFKIEFGKDWAKCPFSERYGLIPADIFNGIDFLKSKGYAFPYMGISINTLIAYGWLVLE